MSAVPITIATERLPATTMGRAYAELADGLYELADALRRGDVAVFAAPRPPALVLVPPVPTGEVRRAFSTSHLVTTMATEVVKTGLVVLVAYQGLLTLLPAPERPRFASEAGEASPAAAPVVPSLDAAATAAAGGRVREVEADVDGRSRVTTAP